ncbi:hypothetical protein GGR55DRAFT_680226 [Xylaria sp. FL0064]|nr:hypothetical protein GGR55DRAFT_680226 [Xylaria sp. FL0064]
MGPGAFHDTTGEDDDSRHGSFGLLHGDDGTSSVRSTIQSAITTIPPTSHISTSLTASSWPSNTNTATTTIRASGSFNASIPSNTPTSTLPPSEIISEGSPTGLGTVTGVVLGSVIGAVAAMFIIHEFVPVEVALAWLTIRKSIARRRGSTHAHSWNFWTRKKAPTRRRSSEESTEYRKPELDATETAVGYNPGAPHELYVPKIGHDHPAELDTVRSPVELMG